MLDSGCTQHMTGDPRMFNSINENKSNGIDSITFGDNGSEFKNTRIDELCDEFGIRCQFSTKYTPQSNALVERKNKTLIGMARSMLSEYNVSHSFWAEAINMACYCSNQLYCHPLKEKTLSTKYGRQSTEGVARGGRLSVDGACNQEPDGDTRRRDSDLDRFGPSGRRNTLCPVSLVYCIEMYTD